MAAKYIASLTGAFRWSEKLVLWRRTLAFVHCTHKLVETIRRLKPANSKPMKGKQCPLP
jgi:hypothetical protein